MISERNRGDYLAIPCGLYPSSLIAWKIRAAFLGFLLGVAVDWVFGSSSKFTCCNPSLQRAGVWRWGLWVLIKCEDRALMNGITLYKKKGRGLLWPPDAKSWLAGKDPDPGKDWRQEQKGTTEDEMVGWHHRLDGHEFAGALGVMAREAWRAAVHGVAKSWTRLSDWTEEERGSFLFPHPLCSPPCDGQVEGEHPYKARSWAVTKLWICRHPDLGLPSL